MIWEMIVIIVLFVFAVLVTISHYKRKRMCKELCENEIPPKH